MTKTTTRERVTPGTERETITPEKARKYLEANYHNRPIRGSWVDELVGKIQRGQWEFTHQGIAFDITGRLVDGQHRLMAIAQSGIACDALVTRDLSDGVFRNIDAGKVRSLSDRVHLTDEGVHQNAIAVSIMRAYVMTAIGKNPPPQELIENQFIAMADEVMEVTSAFAKRQRHITTGPIGAAVACYMTKHPTRAREFMQSLIAGSKLEPGSPVLALRDAAMEGRLGTGGGLHEAYWKTIGATKAFHERKPVASIRAALEDWRGNEPTRLSQAKSASARLAAQTVQARKTLERAEASRP